MGAGHAPPFARPWRSRRALVWERLVASREARAGAALLAIVVALAVVGPSLTEWQHHQHDFAAFRDPPSPRHWFGTTQTGRDVYALTMHGMRTSLLIGLVVAAVSTGLAAIVGAFAGYCGGLAGRLLMWGTDLLLVLPGFLVVAVASPLLRGAGWPVFALLLAALMWMVTARVVRGMTLSLREREFVLAARFMGVSTATIVFRHLLPNLSPVLIVDLTLNVSAAITTESGLSYFGFGVQPPHGSLGTVLADGAMSATTHPWLFVPAALLLVIVVLGVNLLGDGLRDALDPTEGERPR